MTLPKELLAFDSGCTLAKPRNYKTIIKQPKCILGKPSNFKVLAFAIVCVLPLLAFAIVCVLPLLGFAIVCVLPLLGFAIAVIKKCIIGVNSKALHSVDSPDSENV